MNNHILNICRSLCFFIRALCHIRWALTDNMMKTVVASQKIIECVVKSRLSDHLTSNTLVNPHESAYCIHQSTETALLYKHDHLINAIGSQKISCLCLLDLSAAFDIIDHNLLLLLTRLSSWFGI